MKAAKEQLADFHGVALIMFADTPLVTAQTLAALATAITDGSDIAVLGFEASDPVGYGRLVIGADQCLKKIVEHTDATKTEQEITLVNGGVMAVRCPLLFDLLEEVTPDNASGEFYLTDIVEIATAKALAVTYRTTDEHEIAGVNCRQDLAYIEAILQDRLRNSAMDQGVTIRSPRDRFFERGYQLRPRRYN